MIFGSRVRLVRKLRRLTQTEFAEHLGIRQESLSSIESGIKQPSKPVLERLVDFTGFPADFFTRPPGPELPLGSLDFRARRSLARLDLEQAHGWGELCLDAAVELRQRHQLPPPRIPALTGATPEVAATEARNALGLSPDRPIPNLVYALEQAGVCVLALPIELAGRDAFSTWIGLPERFPFVGLPLCRAGERQRRSAAHELGHLVLHVGFRGSLGEMENEADRFASEFLFPERAARDYLSPPLRLQDLFELKSIWGVSVQSLVMRAWELGMLSTRRKQQLFQHMASQWPLRSEPQSLPIEKPRLFRKIVETDYGLPPNVVRLAADLALPATFLKSIIEAHATKDELRVTVRQPVDTSKVIPLKRSPDRRFPP